MAPRHRRGEDCTPPKSNAEIPLIQTLIQKKFSPMIVFDPEFHRSEWMVFIVEVAGGVL
jgi:hypothetical protein